MPKASDWLSRLCPGEVENEKLYLPSDLSTVEREADGVAVLGGEEAKLREGEAFDALHAIRTAVKAVVAMRDRKRRDARGQAENTRSGRYIRDAEVRRDRHMETYAAARNAMLALGSIDADNVSNSPFPPLALQDTFMKSRQRKRGVGDSRRTDGALWRMGMMASTSSSCQPVVTGGGEMDSLADSDAEGSKTGTCVVLFSFGTVLSD